VVSFRKQKELMKALETPEEKRLRRLAKKEAKGRKKREKEGWDKECLVSVWSWMAKELAPYDPSISLSRSLSLSPDVHKCRQSIW
jgi:hypothetical protein